MRKMLILHALVLFAVAAIGAAFVWPRLTEKRTEDPAPEIDARGGGTESNGANAATSESAPENGAAEKDPAHAQGPEQPGGLRVGPVRPRPGPGPKGSIAFPDGTWLPSINGVQDPPPFPGMPNRRPFAPVAEVFRNPDDGTLWFRHTDGTHSSVQDRDVTVRGQVERQAVWAVGSPRPSVDIGDREIDREMMPGPRDPRPILPGRDK